MVKISENTIGVNLAEVITPGIVRKNRFKTGQTVRGDDGSRYQYGLANAAIPANTATCTISVSSGEYVVTAVGGDATSPSTAMEIGDYGWFKLA